MRKSYAFFWLRILWKYRRWLKYKCQQNLGVDKTLALTKSRRQQNLGVDKTSASTKSWRQQNLSIDKTSASTKYRRQQSLTFLGPANSSVAGFSLTSLLFSSWRFCPFLMQLPSDCGSTAAWVIWAHSTLYCPAWSYRSMLEILKILASTKYWRPPRFHCFSPNFGCQYLCS